MGSEDYGLVIHGGAGRAIKEAKRERDVKEALDEIGQRCWEMVQEGKGATEVASLGCRWLEACEHFNAGRGSAVQLDGSIRMSASLMDGAKRAFSGVINVAEVAHPIDMAEALQGAKDRVLDSRGAARLAREMGLEVVDNMVDRRLRQWFDARREGDEVEQAAVVDEEAGIGTVGVVVCDRRGRLAASTSTGGRGFERPGRVSDAATVAGNYATPRAAVSCTGIGEDIVDEALAARVVVRAEGGEGLAEAMAQSVEEAGERGRRLAAIGVDDKGRLAWAKSTELLIAQARRPGVCRWTF